ncbi:MAG: hypothetical protein MJE77_32730 [Proteobacteria bacterium]|nr:hypothetical protein [Pseudomonadota bacterium]
MSEQSVTYGLTHSASDALLGIPVMDEHGAAFELEQLWIHNPVILAFVRHFG